MEYEIYHHGVKGQKWGVRRYQKKDGSLTRLGKKRLQSGEDEKKEQSRAQKKDAKEQLKAQKRATQEAEQKKRAEEAEKKKAEQEAADKKKAEEEREAIRAKLLNSNDAQELYNNRNLLTTQELNERLSRIDTERRLANEAAKSKVTFGDRVGKAVDKASKTANTIETAYQITQKPFFKALMKQVKGEEAPKTSKFDVDKVLEKVDTMSTKELTDTLARTRNINSIEMLVKQIKSRRDETS